MPVNELPLLDLEPRRALGAGCCTVLDVELAPAAVSELTAIAKALADPVRLQIVDILRRQAGEVCVCDLQALFDVSQPTLSHHLRKLREAGLVGVVRREQWAYYYVLPDRLEALKSWLS
jgi:ArsR family transcriptional regulator